MITVDFETYYDKDFSLSKMTTEEYIRDPRFEVIGVSVQIDDGKAVWFSGDFASTHLWLQQFNWAEQAVASHNAMFDMSILAWRFGIFPLFVVDTMSMANALYGIEMSVSLASMAKHFNLPDKGTQVANALGLHRRDFTPVTLADYGDYCCHDTFLCREIYKAMKPYLPTEEMMAMDRTIQMYSRPTIVIDRQQAQLALKEHMHTKATTLQALGVTQEALRSDDIMAQMLINLGCTPPTKRSGKRLDADGNPLEVWAFAKSDTDFMDLLEGGDSAVAALVEARLANKTSIIESRLSSFIDISGRGAMPYPLAYWSAQPTGRWQAWKQQKINLQNLPRAKKGMRSPLRDALCAPPGYKMGVVDLSQIELRVNAWQSNQQSVLDTLRTGGDVYSNMATRIYGYQITKAMGKSSHIIERFVGKTATLGCGYQCGGPKFTTMLKVAARRDGFKLEDESDAFGKKCVDEYRADNPMVVAFWKDCQRAIEIMAMGGSTKLGPYEIVNGQIWMPDGMWMRYPNLRVHTGEDGKTGYVYDKRIGRGKQTKWIYGGLLCENLSQRVARTVMRDGMLRLSERYWVCGSVHDELIFLFPESDPDEVAVQYAIDCLTQPAPFALGMPLAAEGAAGYRYGDAK